MNDILISSFYVVCAGAVLTLIARSYRAVRFSFHLIFSALYFVTFFGGFPLSMALKYGFDVSLQRPEILFETLAVAAGGYFLYFLSYQFFSSRQQAVGISPKLQYYATVAQNVEKGAVGAQRLRPCDFKSRAVRDLCWWTPAWCPYKDAENHFDNVEKFAKNSAKVFANSRKSLLTPSEPLAEPTFKTQLRFVTACLLLLLGVASLAAFVYLNGWLLFRLEKYSQIFSPLVSGVALKRFFYFVFPALLIGYFLAPSRRNWWLLLLAGSLFGGASYLAVGGTRANLALAVAFFLLIGWKERYLSWQVLAAACVAGVVAMFGLALARYGLDVQGREAWFTFLYLTRDSFSPWENFARILATDVEFQGLMPIVRDFYVYIPQSLWADRPEIAWNAANYFTKELLGNRSGLAMSPTLLGSLYLMGGLPLVAVGMGLIGKLLAETDRLFRTASPLWQGYLLANLFNMIVLVREGADAFVSRWCFFTAVFVLCWGLAYILVGKRNG